MKSLIMLVFIIFVCSTSAFIKNGFRRAGLKYQQRDNIVKLEFKSFLPSSGFSSLSATPNAQEPEDEIKQVTKGEVKPQGRSTKKSKNPSKKKKSNYEKKIGISNFANGEVEGSSELEQLKMKIMEVEGEIIESKKKLEKAEETGNIGMIMMYGNQLTELRKEKNILLTLNQQGEGFGSSTTVSRKRALEDGDMIVYELRQLRKAFYAQSSGSTLLSPVSDASMYRNEVPNDFSIPTYNHNSPPEWIGAGSTNDAVLSLPLSYIGTTESDLVRAIYPVLAEILSSHTIKLVNSETDVFLPVPELPDELDLYNKPDLHLVHPALYCQSKQPANGMVFGKPDVNCLNGIIALLEAKLPPLSDTQVGVLMRYLSYWFRSVRRNVSGIVFNKIEFVYCELADGIFNPEHFIRCRWDAAGSKGLLKRLLVDFTVKPTESMVISELCTRLNVRLFAEPGTSYLGRGAEATVLRVREINGETERALKYYHGEDHIRQCVSMCTRTSDLIQRVPNVVDQVIAHVGEAVSVSVDAQYHASGVLIESVGKPVSAKNFSSGYKKKQLFAHLRALHTLGIVHGDARIQNIVDVSVNNNIVLRWIDLGHNSLLTPELAVADFVTLLESYRGIKFANLDMAIFQEYAENPHDDVKYKAMVVIMMTLL